MDRLACVWIPDFDARRAVDPSVSEVMLASLEALSPTVEEAPLVGCYWVRLSGLALLFPQVQDWAIALRQRLDALLLQASVCIGWTRLPVQAIALADAARGGCQVRILGSLEAEISVVGHIRLAELALLNERLVLVLQEELGVVTVGEARRLSRNHLLRRLGEGGRDLCGLIFGDGERSCQSTLNEEAPSVTRLLPSAISNWSILFGVAEEAFLGLLKLVVERRRCIEKLRLLLFYEGRELRTIEVTAAQPSNCERTWLQLLGIRIESLRGLEAVDELNLSANLMEPDEAQGELFALAPGWDAGRVAEVMAELRVRYGAHCIGGFMGEDPVLPEGAGRVLPFWGVAAPGPIEREVQLVRRIWQSPVSICPPARVLPGGWTLSGGWWRERSWCRHYRWCRQEDGALIWLYESEGRWFWQGGV